VPFSETDPTWKFATTFEGLLTYLLNEVQLFQKNLSESDSRLSSKSKEW